MNDFDHPDLGSEQCKWSARLSLVFQTSVCTKIWIVSVTMGQLQPYTKWNGTKTRETWTRMRTPRKHVKNNNNNNTVEPTIKEIPPKIVEYFKVKCKQFICKVYLHYGKRVMMHRTIHTKTGLHKCAFRNSP